MAASSSSTTNSHKYDVFLSFRGLDTRLTFTAHLHKALEDANFTTFLDDKEIETGLYLKPELVYGIKASKASIIVLSENYASSTWCLEELVLILHQNRTSNHFVYPIFYNVEPTNVRKQKDTFGVAMEKHKRRMEAETNPDEKSQLADKIETWKNALEEVSNLAGKNANGRLETEVIAEVIADIYHKLRVLLRSNLPDLIGMDNHIDDISSWLKDASTQTADILTILGMGGIGKTDLAKYIYGMHCFLFDRSSFIEGISRKCRIQSENMLELQRQLFSDISKSSLAKINHVSEYTSMIENELARKKVLLILDDVGCLDEVYALLGKNGFHQGSKIIITTEDTSLTKKFELGQCSKVQPNHTILLLEGLNDTSSLQLLSLHAFKRKDPTEGYEEVSKKLVKYCQGHPNALKVLGMSLYGGSVDEWEEHINGLNEAIDSRIEKVLRRSFNSLQSPNDEELFKHIATFFAGKDRVFAETILENCHIQILNGIKHLTDRCLLTIGPKNELMMHQLLQQMGRDVVREESPRKLWKRSRLWCHKDSFNVLQQKRGKGDLKGIILDMSMLDEGKSLGSIKLRTEALSKMDNLMLLQLNYVQLKGSYKNFPNQLRWLCMHGFPLKSLPSDLPMNNLVALDMSNSKIKSFDMSYSNIQRPSKRKKMRGLFSKDNRLLNSLKILNLSFCYNLRSLNGLYKLPALERLILAGCRSLIEICETIEKCEKLTIIDLSYCTMLKKLPTTLINLTKLEALSLDGCNLGKIPFDMKEKDLRTVLNANRICIDSQASSSSTVETLPRGLKSFAICLASSLISLSLKDNNLCNESFPMAFSGLSMLKKLVLDGNPIVSLPNCVTSLRRIELLSLEECHMLKTIEHPPSTLRNLNISRWDLLQKIVFHPEMSPLAIALTIYSFAHTSIEIEGIVEIQPVSDIEEEVLCILGWTGLDFIKKQEVQTWHDSRRNEKSQVQLFYEFGIFSTFYGGKNIPNWIVHKSKESSISFTVPSSPNRLTGLNFCHLQTGRDPDGGVNLLTVIVSNKTKNRTWIYKPYIHWAKVDKDCLVLLSHWMFQKNEIEDGDQVTITIPEEEVSSNVRITECGFNYVYDDGSMEEDLLGYYKSWNHIIGGDLSAFRLTTGEYFLDNHRFFWWHIDCPVYRPFIANGASYEEEGVYFKAFPERKCDIVGSAPEDVNGIEKCYNVAIDTSNRQH